MKLEKCPFCGGEAIVVKTERCGRYIGCWDCGGRTEEFETDYAGSAHDKAISAWNRRAEPENNPLTIDELKQMDGEPVWIVLISVCDGYWDICKRNDYDGGDYIDFARIPLKKKYYEKTWLAYRRAQPENKPLTLNEIRGMFGKPVWIVQGNEAYPEETETILVELFREERGYIMFFMFGNEVEDGLLTEYYGKTWRAYRSKPERSEG